MGYKRTIAALVFSVLSCISASAATRTAVSTGNWTTNSTWNCNCQPSAADNIIIPAGITVTIGFPGVDMTGGTVITITVAGTLRLSNASLLIDSNDVINIVSGGQATSSGLGGLVFSGSGPIYVDPSTPITGPATISGGVLPVELISWDAQPSGNSVLLTWVTASEDDSDYFEIYRSEDGESFSLLTSIPAQGTSISQTDYSFLDASPVAGISYYKLTQTDIEGTVQQFEIKKVDLSYLDKEASVYPNPVVEGVLNLDVNFKPTGFERLVIANSVGRVVFDAPIRSNENTFRLPPDIGPGAYFLQIFINDQVIRQHLVVK